MFEKIRAPIVLDMSIPHKEFVNKWSFYTKISPIDRIEELKIVCQEHLDDPKIQEIIPLIEQRLKQQ
jgi:hypothetical protein